MAKKKCDYCRRKELTTKAKKDGLASTVVVRDDNGRKVVDVHVHPRGTKMHELVREQGDNGKPYLRATLGSQESCTCEK